MTRAELRRLWVAAIHRGRPERRAQQRDAKETPVPTPEATKKSFKRWEKYTGKPIPVRGAFFITRKEDPGDYGKRMDDLLARGAEPCADE